MEIDFNKPVQTRAGRRVHILTTGGSPFVASPYSKSAFIILGFIEGEGDCVYRWPLSGLCSLCGETNANDLTNVPEVLEGWVNVYRSNFHPTEIAADTASNRGLAHHYNPRLKCIKVTFEV